MSCRGRLLARPSLTCRSVEQVFSLLLVLVCKWPAASVLAILVCSFSFPSGVSLKIRTEVNKCHPTDCAAQAGRAED